MKLVMNPLRTPGIRPALRKFHRPVLVGATISLSCLVCLTLSVRFSEAQEVLPSAFEGIWSTTVTAITHPDWTIDDLFACNCTRETYEYLDQLLHDPANNHLSAADIQQAIRERNLAGITGLFTETAKEYALTYDHADDPSIQCEYFGAFRTVLHNDPILIEQYEDHISIKGEDMTSDRIIYTDGRSHPENEAPSPLGHSIGWYEGSTLIVETINVSANIAEDNLPIHNSDEARSVERYTRSEDGSRLHMEFTLIDPVMFNEPLILERTRLLTPEVDLLDAPCESISGEF